MGARQNPGRRRDFLARRPRLGRYLFFVGLAGSEPIQSQVETDGRVSRVVLTVEGNRSGPPAHVHPGQEERHYVESGQMTVTQGGNKTVLGSC